jgi:hypothetical protein
MFPIRSHSPWQATGHAFAAGFTSPSRAVHFPFAIDITILNSSSPVNVSGQITRSIKMSRFLHGKQDLALDKVEEVAKIPWL